MRGENSKHAARRPAPLARRLLAWIAAIGLIGLAAVAGAEKAAESEQASDDKRFDLPHLDERIDF